MKNVVQFTNWELLYRGVVSEVGFLKAYDVKLTFILNDGSESTKTLPVLAKSPHYILTSECVIKSKLPDHCEIEDSYLSFQEFLDEVDPE